MYRIVSPLLSLKHSLGYALYFDTNGTAGRLEYFYYNLFQLLVFWLVSQVSEASYLFTADKSVFVVLFLFVFLLLSIWVFLAGFVVSARRWHDLGYSGWYNLLMLIPFLNLAIVVYLLVKKARIDSSLIGG